MGMIVYEGASRFKRFYLKDPFTGKLEPCTEEDFDNIVIKHRSIYEMHYDKDDINAQNFYIDGELEARRER